MAAFRETDTAVTSTNATVMADGRLLVTHRVSQRGVHETAQRRGSGAAAALVRHYVGYEEWPESGFARREVARRGVALILGFGDPIDVYANGDDTEDTPRSLGAFVVGSQSGWSMTGIGGHQLGVQIELTPAGAVALFGDDVPRLSDAALPLDEVLGERGRLMVDRLAHSSTWADRLDLLDRELAGAGSGDRVSFDAIPTLPPEVTWLRRQLEASRGRARVEPLMDETGWSRRHMTERFRAALGVSPKVYARLCRFEHASFLLDGALDGFGPARTLADVAISAGYYDQSHLTRDFAALAGMTPGAYAANSSAVPEVRFVQDASGSRPSQ
jgi:AraC-like DNA-binding protein